MLVCQKVSNDELEYQEYLKTKKAQEIQTTVKPGTKIRVTKGYWKDTVDIIIKSGNIETMFGTVKGILIQPGTAGEIVIEDGNYEIVPNNTELKIMKNLYRRKRMACA